MLIYFELALRFCQSQESRATTISTCIRAHKNGLSDSLLSHEINLAKHLTSTQLEQALVVH